MSGTEEKPAGSSGMEMSKVFVNSFGCRDCNYFESRLEQGEELGQLALWPPGPCRNIGLVFQ